MIRVLESRPMYILFAILGVLLLVSEIVALRYVNRTMKKGSFNRDWRVARLMRNGVEAF